MKFKITNFLIAILMLSNISMFAQDEEIKEIKELKKKKDMFSPKTLLFLTHQ